MMKDCVRGKYFCNRKYKIAYLQINKCACISIASYIASLSGKTIVDLWSNTGSHFDIITKDNHKLGDYLTFTFVRNPYDRFLSFYKNWVIDPPHTKIINYYKPFGLYLGMSFEDCVSKVIKIDKRNLENHLAPFSSFIFNDNELRIKFIGKVENIVSDFELIKRYTGTNDTLLVVNKSKKEEETYYNDELRYFIYNYYKRDFLLFGYDSLIGDNRQYKYLIESRLTLNPFKYFARNIIKKLMKKS